MQQVMIVGAGLSGLTAAYYLKKQGIDALVIEARDRIGGRIETVQAAGNSTPVEMGATWFSEKHTHLMKLLKELDIPFFKQFQKGVGVFETDISQDAQLFKISDTEEASYRIAGGTSILTIALADYIGPDRILLRKQVTNVSEQRDHIEILTGDGGKHKCKNLIITIPPFLLLSQRVNFEPALPQELVTVMENTHTWMGDAIKFAVEYKAPFWRNMGYSGTMFSHAGVAIEVYDHSNFEESNFALKGFLTTAATHLKKEERELKVIEQFTRLLGKEASSYISYTERLWEKETYTYAEYDKFVMPHQNNGHPFYSQPLMNDKLYLAGSESSPVYGGYMDGAVYCGLITAQKILNNLN